LGGDTGAEADALASSIEYTDDHAEAAVRIQALERGKQARRQLAGGTGAEADALASTIEYTDDHADAAVRIQALERGKQARRQLGQGDAGQASEVTFPAAEDYSEEQQDAIVKIQAMERGVQARRQLLQCDEAVVAEGEESFPSAAEYSDEQHEAVIKIQAVERGREARKRLDGVTSIGDDADAALDETFQYSDEHYEAAIRIQAVERGKQGRKRSIEIQSNAVAVNGPEDDWGGDIAAQKDRSATIIQSHARRRQAEARVKSKRYDGKKSNRPISRPSVQTTGFKTPGKSPRDEPMSPIKRQLNAKLSSVRDQIDDLQEKIVAALSTLDEHSLTKVTEYNAKVETLVKIERQLSIAIEHRTDMEKPVSSEDRSPSIPVMKSVKSTPALMPAPPARGYSSAPRELPPVDARGQGTSHSSRSGKSTNRSAQKSARSVRSALPGGHRERLVGFYSAHNPSMLDKVDAILDKYAGHEEVLFHKLERKYGLQSEPAHEAPPAAAPAARGGGTSRSGRDVAASYADRANQVSKQQKKSLRNKEEQTMGRVLRNQIELENRFASRHNSVHGGGGGGGGDGRPF